MRNRTFLLPRLRGHVVPIETSVGGPCQTVGGAECGSHVPPIDPVVSIGGDIEYPTHPVVEGVERSISCEQNVFFTVKYFS